MWALITAGVVRELTAEDPAGRFHPSLHWQECDAAVAVGDLWTGAGFEAPPAAPAAPRIIGALDFRRKRFTETEREAITLAASRGLEENDARLQLWLDDLAAAGVVNLDSAELRERVAALALLGLIEGHRVAEILA
jgi:hypothetical protein